MLRYTHGRLALALERIAPLIAPLIAQTAPLIAQFCQLMSVSPRIFMADSGVGHRGGDGPQAARYIVGL